MEEDRRELRDYYVESSPARRRQILNVAMETQSDPEADERAQRHAGMVFSRMEGNELFDRLVQGSSSAGKKITELMDRYLNDPAVSKGERPETREARSPDMPVIPGNVEDFNILDFV